MVEKEVLRNWTKDQVSKILQYEDDGQITDHLLSLDDNEIKDMASALLGASRNTQRFVDDLIKRRSNRSKTNVGGDRQMVAAKNEAQTKEIKTSSGENLNLKQTKTKSKKKVKMVTEAVGGMLVTRVQNTGNVKRGREECQCMATKHALVTNCCACGKIVCELEGEGECFFCGSWVTKDGTVIAEQFVQVMRGNTEEEEGNYEKYEGDAEETGEGENDTEQSEVMKGGEFEELANRNAKGLAKAEAHKNKLLKYAKNQEKQTHVIDEQADYYDFEGNMWLNEEEKKKKKKEAEAMEETLNKRREHHITLDFLNKKVSSHRDEFAEIEFHNPTNRIEPKKAHLNESSVKSSSLEHYPTLPSESNGATKYYANDTLSGRAKQVYADLLNAVQTTKEERLAARKANSNKNLSALKTALASKARVQHDGNSISLENLPQLDEKPSRTTNTAPLSSSNNNGSKNDAAADFLKDVADACAGVVVNTSEWGDDKDKGICLSMHQPWASLLVHGIKRYEGRGWFTKYRGRLWIASTSQEASAEDIEMLEDEYRQVYCDGELGTVELVDTQGGSVIEKSAENTDDLDTDGNGNGGGVFDLANMKRGKIKVSANHKKQKQKKNQKQSEKKGNDLNIPFPTSYPVSALLGCVDMVDCLTLEEFQRHRHLHQYTHKTTQNGQACIEDSMSKNVFVCRNPRVMRIARSIRGNHKLWNLDPQVLNVAKASIKPVSTSWFASRFNTFCIGKNVNVNPSLNSLSSSSSTSKEASYGVGGGGGVRIEKEAPFDLWPTNYGYTHPQYLNARQSVADTDITTKKKKIQAHKFKVLQSGLILVKKWMTLQEQQLMVDTARELGLGKGATVTTGEDENGGGFYTPSYDAYSQQKLKMCCLGKHWNLVDKSYDHETRSNYDGAPILALPPVLLNRARACVQDCQHVLDTSASASSPPIPRKDPDICLLNYYDQTGRLGFHQDIDETSESLKAGYPVISFSFGDTASFVYKSGEKGDGSEKENVVELESGDALIFYGPSRLIYHAVRDVQSNTAPNGLHMRRGRLNFTYRTH